MIWVFSDLYWPAQGGVAVTVDFIIETLRANGHSVGLVTVGDGGRSSADAVVSLRTVCNLNYPGDQTAVFSAHGLSRTLARHGDASLFVVATPGRIGLAALGLAQRRGIPSILLHLTDIIRYRPYYPQIRIGLTNLSKIVYALTTRQSGTHRRCATPCSGCRTETHTTSRTLATWLLGVVYGRADQVMALSEAQAQDLRDAGVPACRVSVWESGITVPSGWTGLETSAVRRAVRFLYVGRIVPEKNLTHLLNAFRQVLDHFPTAELVLAGEGRSFSDLRQLARDLHLGPSVQFLGPVDRAKLSFVYASADIFVFPSITDTQGLVLSEAAYFGLPLITADSALRMSAAATLVSGRDEVELAEAMIKLAVDPALRLQAGHGARRLAVSLLDESRLALLAAVDAARSGRG